MQRTSPYIKGIARQEFFLRQSLKMEILLNNGKMFSANQNQVFKNFKNCKSFKLSKQIQAIKMKIDRLLNL